jgi:hypothetical protein
VTVPSATSNVYPVKPSTTPVYPVKPSTTPVYPVAPPPAFDGAATRASTGSHMMLMLGLILLYVQF